MVPSPLYAGERAKALARWLATRHNTRHLSCRTRKEPRMSKTNRPAASCPDCDSIVQTDALTRRELIRKASGAALIGAAASAGLFELVVGPTRAMAAEAAAPAA